MASKVVTEVDGVLTIRRNYSTGLATIQKAGESSVSTRVFDERLYKLFLKKGYPEKTDDEIDELACAWFPELKGIPGLLEALKNLSKWQDNVRDYYCTVMALAKCFKEKRIVECPPIHMI